MLLDEARIDYKHQHPWESYAASIESEWLQCQDEGLDVGAYAELFQAISKLEPGPIKDRLCDTLYTALSACGTRPDWPYQEPSALEDILLECPASTHASFPQSIMKRCRNKFREHGTDV